MDELPEDLRADLLRLLDLRQLAPEDDEKDRPKKLKQLRKISADTLGRTISQIHGYSVDVLGLPEVSSVKELLREDLVIKYIRWNVNVRELDGDAFYARMQLLYANVKHYSQFADINPTWFDRGLKYIPRTDKKTAYKRRERREISFDQLERLVSKLEMRFNHNI